MSEQLRRRKSETKIIKLSKTFIDQNYFQFLDATYIQSEGLAIEATASFKLSEFYLQYLENSKIYNILLGYDIEGYFRCFDDILLSAYNERNTNIDDLLDHFNNLTTKLKLILEKQADHKINFLDITISTEPKKLSIDIYRSQHILISLSQTILAILKGIN